MGLMPVICKQHIMTKRVIPAAVAPEERVNESSERKEISLDVINNDDAVAGRAARHWW